MVTRSWKKLAIPALAGALGVAAVLASGRHGLAQSAPPCTPTCPPDMKVQLVRIPHRETVQIAFPSSGAAQSPDTDVFTLVPQDSGLNFHVTHISGRFSSSSLDNPANNYEVDLVTPVDAGNPSILASMVPSENAFALSGSTQVRTLNLPWDASYVGDRTYQVRVRRASTQPATTVRLTFDGYLEPDCGLDCAEVPPIIPPVGR